MIFGFLFSFGNCYQYLTNNYYNISYQEVEQTYVFHKNYPYTGIGCSTIDTTSDIIYFISEAMVYRYGSTAYRCSRNNKHVEILKFNSTSSKIIDRLTIGNNPASINPQGDIGSDEVKSCGINKNLNILYYLAGDSLNCGSVYHNSPSLVRINLDSFTFRDRNNLKDITDMPEYGNSYDYLNFPLDSLVKGKYLYVCFGNYQTGVIEIDISIANPIVTRSFQKTYEATTNNGMDMSGNSYTETVQSIKYILIDKKEKNFYFIEDVGWRDAKIMKTPIEHFDANHSTLHTLEGISYISEAKINPLTGRIYLIAGLLSSSLYQLNNDFNRIEIPNQCGKNSLAFPTEWGPIYTLIIDPHSGYIYALPSMRTPYIGIVKINSDTLVMDPNLLLFSKEESFTYHNHFGQQVTNKYINYYSNLNISAVSYKNGKIFLGSGIYGRHPPYIATLNLIGCVPGKDINQTYCKNCIPGKYTSEIGTNYCYDCPQGYAISEISAYNCNKCHPGLFSTFVGSSSCQSCNPGLYSDLKGTIECFKCPAGKYSMVTSSVSIKSCLDCQDGYISGDGFNSCQICSIGKFSSKGRECRNCPKGKYSNNVGISRLDDCIDCPNGRFNSKNGSTLLDDCIKCIQGKYSIILGSITSNNCLSCTPGKFRSNDMDPGSECHTCPLGDVSNNDFSNCYSCPPGKYSSLGTECLNCPTGKYNQNGGSNSLSSCKDCPKGRYNDLSGSDSLDRCYQCNSGKYSSVLGSSSGHDCISCDSGKYRSGSMNPGEECQICPDGEISNNDFSGCITCPSGKYANLGRNCLNCPTGKFNQQSGSNGLESCLSCPKGRYNNMTGSESLDKCYFCIPGKYSSVLGSSSGDDCISCDSGKFRDDSMNPGEECQRCPNGEISTTDFSGCITCFSGKYASLGTECLECPTGKFNPQERAFNPKSCIQCPTGRYNNQSSSSSLDNCLICPHGKINLQLASTSFSSCIDCEAGRYRAESMNPGEECAICPGGSISKTGANFCLICHSGKWAGGDLSTDHVSCTDCIEGKYNQFSGSNSIDSCLDCNKGKYSGVSGLNRSKGCIDCNVGKYNDQLGSINIFACNNCPVGKFRQTVGGIGLADCLPCSAGRFSLEGSDSCIICVSGKYAAFSESNECIECEAGKYTNQDESITCLDCPKNSLNKIDFTGCECQKDFYQNGYSIEKPECNDCPTSAVCKRNSNIKTMVIKKGYWRHDPNTTEIWECRERQSCSSNILMNNSDDLCRLGHKGPLCDVCLEGYAKTRGLCAECPEEDKTKNWMVSITAPFVLTIGLFFLVKTANPKDKKKEAVSGVAKILFNYLQVFSLASNFDIKWPDQIQSLFSTTEDISNLKISFYSSDCALGWKFYDKFLIYVTIPIMYICLVVLVMSIITCSYKCKECKAKKKIVQNYKSFFTAWLKTSTIVGLFLMYPSIVKNSLSIINCIQIGDKSYLYKDLSVQCYDDAHNIYKFVAYAAIIVYGFGIPFLGLFMIYEYRNRLFVENDNDRYEGPGPLSFIFHWISRR